MTFLDCLDQLKIKALTQNIAALYPIVTTIMPVTQCSGWLFFDFVNPTSMTTPVQLQRGC